MGKFKPGEGGRKPGALNKTTKQVKEVFAEAFAEMQQDPKTSLVGWGKQNLAEFYKLTSKLIPISLGNDPDSPLTTPIDNNTLKQIFEEARKVKK